MTTLNIGRRSLLSVTVAGLPVAVIGRAHAAPQFRFRLGHPLSTQDGVHTAMLSFAEGVARSSGGRMEITVFPSDQLGAQSDLGEMVRQGATVLQVTDPLFIGQYVADASVLQAPYLLNKPDDFRKILNTPWLIDLETRLAAKGIRPVTWNSYFGTRQILSKRPLHKASDLAGLNFRCAPAPMYVEMVKAMGARPVTTGYTEVYTGLAQGALDMLEAPLATMWASKLYEQAKFAVLTNHIIGWDTVIMSESVYQSMPADLRAILFSEAAKAADLMTGLKRAEETAMIPKYRDVGVTVIEDVDLDAFRKATASIYENYAGFTPGLHSTIQKLLAS